MRSYIACGNLMVSVDQRGARGSLVVMPLRYKPAGRGFDSRFCNCNFSVT
jgi:hypothetical protein